MLIFLLSAKETGAETGCGSNEKNNPAFERTEKAPAAQLGR